MGMGPFYPNFGLTDPEFLLFSGKNQPGLLRLNAHVLGID